MNRTLRKAIASTLILGTVVANGNVVNAGTFNLHYTSGAPSSSVETEYYYGYTANGLSYAKIGISTYDVECSPSSVTFSQSPSLNQSEFNKAFSTKRDYYDNGVTTQKNQYINGTAYLNAYRNQRYFYVNGSIHE